MHQVLNTSVKKFTFTVAMSAVLVACGGGSDDTPAATAEKISGVAAIGAPIVDGTVTLKCSGEFTATTKTDAEGKWSVNMPAKSLPCALRVENGMIVTLDDQGKEHKKKIEDLLHSWARELGNANITPLTDAMVSLLTQQAPATWFDTASAAEVPDANAIKDALTKLQAALNTLPGKPQLPEGFNPVTSSFEADPTTDPADKLLEDYRAALDTIGLDYASAAQKLTDTQPAFSTQAFAGTAFTTPHMTQFRAGAVKKLDGSFVISMPDPNRQLITATVSLDDLGNVSGFLDELGNVSEVKTPFAGVASLLGNRIAQYCVDGKGAFSNTPSQYAYISDAWEAVTDAKEMYGKIFDDYEDCQKTGTIQFLEDDSIIYTQDGKAPDEPDFGFAKALANGTEMVDEKQGSVTRVKAYKLKAAAGNIYAYIGVSTQKGETKPVIDGGNNYVTMGISRMAQ